MSNSQHIGAGAPRPVYKPMAILCPSCGASLTRHSEHSQQIVCEYCDERIDCSRAVAKALGKSHSESGFHYDVELNHTIEHEGHPYIVIGRMTHLDSDNEIGPKDYLLFNAQQGTFWMTVYSGYGYYLTKRSRMIPPNVFEDSRREIQMPDGSRWKRSEQEVYTLAHVDGAWPWIAKVGDKVETVELSSVDSSKLTLAIERPVGGGEIECSLSTEISRVQWMKFLGKEIPPPRTMSTAALWMGRCLCFAVWLGACMAGTGNDDVSPESVFTDEYNGTQLNSEVVTPTFEIVNIEEPVAIELTASVDNSWMALNYAILQSAKSDPEVRTYPELLALESELPIAEQTQMIETGDADIFYYHGYEDGESYSEGSPSQEILYMFTEPGHYRILFQGVYGTSDTPDSQIAEYKTLYVNVVTGYALHGYYLMLSVIALGMGFLFDKKRTEVDV